MCTVYQFLSTIAAATVYVCVISTCLAGSAAVTRSLDATFLPRPYLPRPTDERHGCRYLLAAHRQRFQQEFLHHRPARCLL